jgi:2-octaprenyl-6-methoxyphenol hydroxylase
MSNDAQETDCIVVGGGPAGLIAATALVRRGVQTMLLAPKPQHPDRRTTALLGSSVDILKELGVWEAVEASAAPLRKLRLVDGTRRLIRTPEVLFDSGEIGLDAFGYNIANEDLLAVLRTNVAKAGLRVIEQSAVAIEFDSGNARVTLADGNSIRAKLIVAADGRNSLCRAAADIRISKRPLSQHAVALNLSHSRPHNDISTEFHTDSGPFTLVPMQGMRSSLVWVCKACDVERLRAASAEELSREIENKSHFMLGEVTVNGPRGIFPLGVEIADRFADKRVALVGEAGHVIPPIGAQGLNLGIRDAEAIARLAGDALHDGADPGSETLLAAYDLERRADIRGRAAAVEMLGRSLLTEFLPVHIARGIGLEIASRIPILRRSLMRGGLGGGKQSEIA